MKKMNKKKGFTIVELVIVIAVIGILAAILIPTFVNLTSQANRVSNESFVKNINTQLAMEEAQGKKSATASDALKKAQKMGFHVDDITPYDGNDIIYDEINDRFAIVKGDFAENQNAEHVVFADASFNPAAPLYKFWKFYDAMPSSQNYSIIAKKAWNVTNIENLKVGFDAGEASGISSVSYVGNGASAQKVTIRTNSESSTLTVNGYVNPADSTKGDIVVHHGVAGALNIIKCATGSYHENGKVGFAEIKTGRIVLEPESTVEHIHINSNGSNAFEEVVIKDNGTENLPQTITRDEVTVESATLVVTVESKTGAQEEVYVYASGTSGTTQKTETQNTDVESALGGLVLDNGSTSKALNEEKKSEAKDEVAGEAVTAASEVDFGNSVARIQSTGYPTLQAACTAAQAGNVIVMLKDTLVESGVTMGGTATYAATINKSVVLNGAGYHVTTKTDRVFGIKGESSNNPIDVTIKNVTLTASDKDAAQCIYTNDYLNSLTLDNVVADNTAANTGYIQAITVSYGSDATSKRHLTIKDSRILNKPNKGYTIIFWVPTEIGIIDSEIQGWSPLYFKPTSVGSSISIKGGSLSCVGIDGSSNSFGLINFETGAVGVPVQIKDTDISVETAAQTAYQSIVSFSSWNGPNNGSVVTIDGGSVSLTGEHAIFEIDNGADNSLTITNCEINNNGEKSSSYSYKSPELHNLVAYMWEQELDNQLMSVCGGYYNFTSVVNQRSGSWFSDGEWLEFYSSTVVLEADVTFNMNSSYKGTFGLLLGGSTLDANGHKITIAEDVTLKTDVRLADVFAAPTGYTVVETELEGDSAYHYSYRIALQA